MKVRVLYDANWEAKIDHALRVLSLPDYFDQRDYGSGVAGVVIVLMCRDPELHHRQRIRFERSTRTLYLDVMLELSEMTRLEHVGRRRVIADRLLAELIRTFTARKFEEFDSATFMSDLRLAIQQQLLGSDADRFDHLCKPQAAC
jgi:hypothetical protein